MNIIRGLAHLKRFEKGCVLTIGNFDGVHIGHRAIINIAQQEARALQLPLVVITFDPQPREYFVEKSAPARLSRFREKVTQLQKEGVEHILRLPFNANIANFSAEDFVIKILVEKFNVKCVVVGQDFRFGKGRAGDIILLKTLGVTHGFSVSLVPEVLYQEQRVSSSRIREALRVHDFTSVQALLGRAYSMEGRVAHGHQRGRIIGFPTANIFLHRAVSPVGGVYAVKLYGAEKEGVCGVANVGNRPTVDGSRTLLEVHLFDFDRDIYGAYVRVEFFHHLRDEKKFDSFEALKQQILLDAREARDYFKRTGV